MNNLPFVKIPKEKHLKKSQKTLLEIGPDLVTQVCCGPIVIQVSWSQVAKHLHTNSGKKQNQFPLIYTLLNIQDTITQLQDNFCYLGLMGYL